MLDFLAPSIVSALRRRYRLSDRYGLIQQKVMCLVTVDVYRFQDLEAA
jgi:hypothetical protein